LESSDLYDHVPSRNGVMRRAIPRTLVDFVGLETLLTRLPEPYQKALFSSWVASHFVSIFCSVVNHRAHCFHLDI
jgi:glutamate dehydrogenase